MPKSWILRDMMKRTMAAEAEPIRQTLKYIVHNQQFGAEIRAQAALDLSRMPGNTRIGRVKNRCIISSRGRGIMRDFKISRMQFRHWALMGELPGVQKANW